MKDIDFGENEGDFMGPANYDIDDYKERIRQEAIKWINKMDIDKDFGEVSNRHAYRREEYLKISRNIKQWIKHFFNIEESDIKNG